MELIRAALYRVCRDDHPVTVRQVFYRLVAEGVIDKTRSEYKSTVIRLLGEMRRAGDLPYSWITDATRWIRKPRTWDSVEDLLKDTAKTYRRNLWRSGDDRVEVWLEKEALAGVLVDVTDEWDVPLMVTKGDSSITFLRDAAEVITDAYLKAGKTSHLYYFGDHDPSGIDIRRVIRRELIWHVVDLLLRRVNPHPAVPDDVSGWGEILRQVFTFTPVAVTPEQIDEWQLPTRPTTKSTRSKGFVGGSVEVDAIPPHQLRQLCRAAITHHVDREQLDILLAVEAAERETLEQLAAGFGREAS